MLIARYAWPSPSPSRPTSDALHPALAPPQSLTRLRLASEGAERENAWAAFIAEYSDVVLRACRAIMHDHDGTMDAYAHVLQALRANDCNRLRAYTPSGNSRFETWLLVVSRRLALDHYRRRYGRPRSVDTARRAEHARRRDLVECVSAELDADQIPDPSQHDADERLRRAELNHAIRAALQQLPPADRLLLALRFVDERPIREIARALALPTVFHVYRRLGAVLRELRRALMRRGIEDPLP